MHTTGSSDMHFSTPESTDSAIYLFSKFLTLRWLLCTFDLLAV